MLRLGLILIILQGFLGDLKAQYHEIGLWAGISSYYGDLTPSDAPTTTVLNFATGAMHYYNFNPYLSIRTSFSYAQISGHDQHRVNSIEIQARNLSFKTTVLELSLMAQLNVMPFFIKEKQLPYAFYLMGGFAGFYFNPKANYQGDWIALQPLGTEGQGLSAYPDRKKYNLLSMAIPFGAGVKFAMSPKVCFALELVLRPTLSDYLDDVSTTYASASLLEQQNGELSRQLANRTSDLNGDQVNRDGQTRGNALDKDWYVMAAAVVSYRFISKKQATEIPYLFDKWL